MTRPWFSTRGRDLPLTRRPLGARRIRQDQTASGDAVRFADMGCPHGCGDPLRCSQCLGAKAAIVTRSPSGELLVDGKPEGEREIPVIGVTRYVTRQDVIERRRVEARVRAAEMSDEDTDDD